MKNVMKKIWNFVSFTCTTVMFGGLLLTLLRDVFDMYESDASTIAGWFIIGVSAIRGGVIAACIRRRRREAYENRREAEKERIRQEVRKEYEMKALDK